MTLLGSVLLVAALALALSLVFAIAGGVGSLRQNARDHGEDLV